MKTEQQPTPQEEKQKIDKGFYASVPRIVRTEYENLTATAKWIYVCLKDLCGENGTCYRALRTLATEIGVSTGVLSQTIKDLVGAGLITAEKKQRPGQSTKGMWHICIVNIWKLNGEKHPTRKCSSPEQVRGGCSPDEHSNLTDGQSPKNVHSTNKHVHHMNKPPLECSPDEKECSQNETKERSLPKHNHSKERSLEENEERVRSVATTSPLSNGGFTHSSSVVSSFSAGLQGEVILPPASVKGVSQSSSERDTRSDLSIDPSSVANEKGRVSSPDHSGVNPSLSFGNSSNPGGDMHTLVQQSSEIVARPENATLNLANSTNVKPEIFAQHTPDPETLCPVPTPNNAPNNGATECTETQPSSYSHSPQHDTSSSDDAVGESEQNVPDVGDYKKENDQDEMMNGGVGQCGEKSVDVVPVDVGQGGQNHPGDLPDDDDDRRVPDAVMKNSTPVDEVVTREMLFKWVRDAHVGLGTAPKKAIDKLLSVVKCFDDVKKRADIARAKFPNKAVYLANLAHQDIDAQLQAVTASESQENAIPGMTEREFNEVVKDIQFAGLGFACAQDEDTGRYFIGIFDSDETQIDINRPRDWYYLDMEKLKKAWDYAHPVMQREAVPA